jgi:RimJ/RimL family protein N-acetyltransferase
VLSPFALESAQVRLEPLTEDHAAPLAAAAAEDRTSYRFTWVPDGLADARHYVAAALADQAGGRTLPLAVRSQADDRIVGCTRFLDLEVFAWPPAWPPGVGRGPEPADGAPPSVAEIGSTWYAASCQRTGINTACKLLLLTHAFEAWTTLRVTLKTDARNAASRRAIERLGARAEGVRRAHSPATDQTIRDTAYYSIIAAEWPAVRDRLTAWLVAGAGRPGTGRSGAGRPGAGPSGGAA